MLLSSLNAIPAWVYLAIAALSNGVGAYFIKISQSSPAMVEFAGFRASPWFFAGAILFGINLFLFARALREIPLTLGYPIFVGVSQGIAMAAALAFLGERLTILQSLGTAFLVFGIAFIVIGGSQ